MYTPTLWQPGEAGGTMVTAARLNNIEKGVKSSDLIATVLTPENFPTIDNTGATDSAPAITAVLADLPRGTRVKFIGTYRVSSPVTIPPERFLTLDFSAAEIIVAGGVTSFSCVGAFESQIAVSAITTEALLVENVVRTLTKLTLATAPTWKIGDVVKVLANDVIPAGHITSDTDKPRVGEFAVVHSVSGTTVYLRGALQESYTQNRRVARMVPGSVTVIDASMDVTDARVTAKTAMTLFRFQNLIAPRVIRPVMRRLTGMGLSFKSCYQYHVDQPIGNYAMDNTDTGNYGYFIHDSGCNHGTVFGGTVSNGRHAYTDGTGLVPVDSTDTSSYGASLNFKWVGGTARFMTAAGFDTHHMSMGAEFIGCTAYVYPEEAAFLFRGRKQRVVDPKVYGGLSVLEVVTQLTDGRSEGESYGHELINPYSEGTAQVVYVRVRAEAVHPSAGIRQPIANVTVHGGTHIGLKKYAYLWNANVRLLGEIDARLGASADDAVVRLRNSKLTGGKLNVDALAVTAVVGTGRVIYLDDPSGTSSDFQMDKITISASAAYIAGAPLPVEVLATAERLYIDMLEFAQPWSTITPVSAPESDKHSVRWRIVSDLSVATTMRSSRSMAYSNAAINGTLRNLFRSHDENLLMTLTVSDATARDVSVLPAGKFTGQQLTILCASTGTNITLRHGSTFGTNLATGASKVMNTTGQTITLFWSGTVWRERVPV